MRKFEAVIFDLDGTLIDSMGVWAEVDREFLEKRNIPVPDDLFDDLKEGNSFPEVARYFQQRFQLSESIVSIMQEWTDMVAEHYRTSIPLKPGVWQFLQELKQQNIALGVGTSNSMELAQTVLQANAVWHEFGAVVASHESLRGKPFPDIFLLAAQKLNVPPEKCLIIEDVLAGVQAAKNAGMTVWAIADSHADNQQAIERTADFYAHNFDEIRKKFAIL